MSSTTTWMDLEMISVCKVSQTKTNIIWYHLYVESLKKKSTNQFACKTKTDSQIQKTNLWLPKGKGEQ